nr:hypothetical protein CFP56_38820 [Quercus suber]
MLANAEQRAIQPVFRKIPTRNNTALGAEISDIKLVGPNHHGRKDMCSSFGSPSLPLRAGTPPIVDGLYRLVNVPRRICNITADKKSPLGLCRILCTPVMIVLATEFN